MEPEPEPEPEPQEGLKDDWRVHLQRLEGFVGKLQTDNRNLRMQINDVEVTLVEELNQGFSKEERTHVLLMGVANNICSILAIIFLVLVFLGVFLKNAIDYLGYQSIITSTTLEEVDRESSDAMYPIVYMCTFDAPHASFYRNITSFYVEENGYNITDYLESDFFTFSSEDINTTHAQLFGIRHLCYVSNFHLKGRMNEGEHGKYMDVLEKGNMFPLAYEIDVREPCLPYNQSFTQFAWFIMIHPDVLTDIRTNDVNERISEMDAKELYYYIMVDSAKDGMNFVVNFLSYGVTLTQYKLRKTIREKSYELLNNLLIGYFFNFEDVLDIQYELVTSQNIDDTSEEPVKGHEELVDTFTIISLKVDQDFYYLTAQSKAKDDFTTPLVQAGGVIIAVKVIPDLIRFCCGCSMSRFYVTYAKSKRKGKFRKMGKMGGKSSRMFFELKDMILRKHDAEDSDMEESLKRMEGGDDDDSSSFEEIDSI